MGKIKKILENCLNLILPQSENAKLLEKMEPDDLEKAARGRAAFFPTPFENTFALFDYRQPIIKTAIWELKYRGNKKNRATLGKEPL